MKQKQSIASLFSDPKLRQRALEEAKAKSSDGFLDMISQAEPASERLDSKKDWIPASKKPTIKDIDYSKTSDEMLLENRAVLKDGGRVSWN